MDRPTNRLLSLPACSSVLKPIHCLHSRAPTQPYLDVDHANDALLGPGVLGLIELARGVTNVGGVPVDLREAVR